MINNIAKFNGGGIFWPNKKPVFDRTDITNNQAGLYGDNFASYPVTLVRFVSQVDVLNKIIEG